MSPEHEDDPARESDADARDRIRWKGMSDYVTRRGLAYGLPLVAISLGILAIQGRLFPMDAEIFLMRAVAPFVAGLMIARLGWAKVVQARLEAHEEERRRSGERSS